MEVLKATDNHLESLVETRLAFLKELHSFSQEEEETLRAKLASFFASNLNQSLFCYIIEKGKEIISCVFVVISEKLPVYVTELGRFGTILNVYTRPLYRKQGLSRKILNEVIKDSRNQKLDKLVLSATEAGYPLYEQLGFKEKKQEYVQMELPLIAF